MGQVGIVGVGIMGRTVAQRFLEGRKEVVVFDTYGPSAEKAGDIGATPVESVSEVGRQADIVLLFLPGPTEVVECVAGKEGLLSVSRPGLTIIDMSTVDPATSRHMAEISTSKGVGYLDAPVLGRPATVGHWALPVGGDEKVLDRCRDFLMEIAAHVIHVGESGSGNKVKLLNQMMFGAINAMTAEMMAVSSEVGIAPKLLYETIMASQAATVSNLFKELGGRISSENYEDPTFTVELLAKDVRLGMQMAKECRTPPILGRTVELINEISLAQGHGKTDTSVMWKSYKSIWSGKK